MRWLLLFTVLSPQHPSFAQGATSAEERIKALEDRLGRLEGAPAKTSLSAFNPAMGMALDAVLRDANDKAGFRFRTAEVNIEAPIDPFLKGWAVINGNSGGVEIEEATLETTALPHNLTVRGGRLFAEFGRFAHFHDHELPVVSRPASLDATIGGESQADGLETSWLVPLPFYLRATAGVYNKIGADNTRTANATDRPFAEFTYLGRLATYADLSDDHSVELGVDSAWTPKRTVLSTVKNTWRALNGVDFTYRWQPTQGGLYKGIVWGTEVMQNDERRFDPATNLPTDRVRAYAGFSYVQLKLGRHWRGGVLVDLAEDLDNAHRMTQGYTAFATCDLTEFQRLRLAFSESVVNVAMAPRVHVLELQWTGVLGHHVHGFRDR